MLPANDGEVEAQGPRLVAQDGYHAEREVPTAAGGTDSAAPGVSSLHLVEEAE
jgi:hypothetical protein